MLPEDEPELGPVVFVDRELLYDVLLDFEPLVEVLEDVEPLVLDELKLVFGDDDLVEELRVDFGDFSEPLVLRIFNDLTRLFGVVSPDVLRRLR